MSDYIKLTDSIATNFNNAAYAIHDWAVKKGWWEGEQNRAERIALMHAELSECLEFLRQKEQPAMDDHVPELTGEAAELADTVIRILDYCGGFGINLGEAIQKKHSYNINRPYKHGGKKF